TGLRPTTSTLSVDAERFRPAFNVRLPPVQDDGKTLQSSGQTLGLRFTRVEMTGRFEETTLEVGLIEVHVSTPLPSCVREQGRFLVRAPLSPQTWTNRLSRFRTP
ncbi:MAG: hypothetical protein OXI66_16320, partial [Boseongicola sp.]|nr:hypothetical protein [Boseongicola sp.]